MNRIKRHFLLLGRDFGDLGKFVIRVGYLIKYFFFDSNHKLLVKTAVVFVYALFISPREF